MAGLLLAANEAKNSGIDVDQLYDDYDKIIELVRMISKSDKDNPFWEKELRLLNDLNTYKDAYLLFASREDVPFTNNPLKDRLDLKKQK